MALRGNVADAQGEGSSDAGAALREIVGEYGSAVLSSTVTLSNLLKDVLPNDPRLSRMLLAAAEDGVADALLEQTSQGMEVSTACGIVSSSFASSSMFAPEACAFVVDEFAVALGLKPGTGAPSKLTVPATPEVDPDAVTVIAPVPGTARRTWRRSLIAPAGGIATVGVVVVILLATGVIGGPSYPHPWCGPVIAQLTASEGTQQSLTAGLRRAQSQDHAPVSNLVSDIYSYETARVAVENGSNLDALSNLASEQAALNVVASDLKAINRDCGQPSGAYTHDKI
jgi:hypothetical protein